MGKAGWKKEGKFSYTGTCCSRSRSSASGNDKRSDKLSIATSKQSNHASHTILVQLCRPLNYISSHSELPAYCPTMKVTIKQWNAVASWRWDMPEDEVCGICRVQFDGTCPTCKYPGDDCTLREYFPKLSRQGPLRFDFNTNAYSNRQMWPFFPHGALSITLAVGSTLED